MGNVSIWKLDFVYHNQLHRKTYVLDVFRHVQSEHRNDEFLGRTGMFYYRTVDICCAKNFPAFAFGLEALETLLAARSASSVRRDQEGASRASRTGSVPRFPVLANPYRCRYMAEFQKWKTVENVMCTQQ